MAGKVTGCFLFDQIEGRLSLHFATSVSRSTRDFSVSLGKKECPGYESILNLSVYTGLSSNHLVHRWLLGVETLLCELGRLEEHEDRRENEEVLLTLLQPSLGGSRSRAAQCESTFTLALLR